MTNNVYQDFFSFQNSFVGSIQLNYTLKGCNLAMANVFQPMNPKDTKGMKVYDYEHSKYFTIGPLTEIVSVKQILISRINNGTWPEYNLASVSSSSTSNYPGLSIKHFRDGIPSVLSIVNSTGNSNNDFLHLFYNFSDKQNVQKFSYNLDRIDIEVFLDFLSNYSTFLSSYIAMAKYENKKNNDANQEKGNYNNTNSNYGNSNRSNNGYNNTPPNNNYNNNSNYNNANKRNYYNGNEQQYQQPVQQNQTPLQPKYQPDQTYRPPYQQPTQPTTTTNSPQYQQQVQQNQTPPPPQYQQPVQQNQTPPPPPINKEQKNNVDVSPDLKSIFD